MSVTPTPPPAASDGEREFLLGLHGYGPQAINAIEALPLDIGRLRAHTREAVAPLEMQMKSRDQMLEQVETELAKAEADRESLRALVVRLREHLTDINEYWNGGNGSAPDACQHSCEISEQALSLVPADLAEYRLVKRSDVKCADCGTPLGESEAKVFTVCEACWEKAYPRAAAMRTTPEAKGGV